MDKIDLKKLLNATGGRLKGNDTRCGHFERIEIDSRRVQPRDLFWALGGERHDGHDFIDEARRNGAAMCMVHDAKASMNPGPMIEVDDTLKALWDYSAWHRRQQNALVVAVTGSFGKTTAREMIHAALGRKYAGTRSPKNFNNHIGVPLSLLAVKRVHEYAVLELGASRVGEIRDLSGIAKPDIGVVTGIGPAHLDGFGCEKRIVETKAELLHSLTCGGFVVLAGDDPLVQRMADGAECQIISVGQREHNHLKAEHVEFKNKRLTFRVDGFRFELPVSGRHHLTSALAAIAIAREMGMADEDAACGLASFEPIAGRCKFKKIGSWNVIDDSYNANPKSVMAACHLLKDWRGANKKILVTGDMLELSDRTPECHYEVGRLAAEAGINRVVAFGPEAKHVVQGAVESGMDVFCVASCRDINEVKSVLNGWLEPEDIVLVKGSRGMRMERIVEWLHHQAEDVFHGIINRATARDCA